MGCCGPAGPEWVLEVCVTAIRNGVRADLSCGSHYPAAASEGQILPEAQPRPSGIVGPVGSNRGFWKVFLALGVGGIALVVLVIAFRPVARTGAIAFAQSNLRTAAETAARIAEDEGSLADATPLRLRAEPEVGRLLFVELDTSSNDSEIVSVWATADAWTGAARADTGRCFWVRILASGETEYGTGTDCSAEEAGEAAPAGWPEP